MNHSQTVRWAFVPVAFIASVLVWALVTNPFQDDYHTEEERAQGHVLAYFGMALFSFVPVFSCTATAPSHRGIMSPVWAFFGVSVISRRRVASCVVTLCKTGDYRGLPATLTSGS